MTPDEAEARIAEIRADKTHPAHSLDQTEAEAGAQALWDLERIASGRAGEKIREENLFLTNPTPGPASNMPPEERAVYLGLVQTELVNAAPTLQQRLGVPIDAKSLNAFAAALQPRPDAWPLRLEDTLRTHPPGTRAELASLHQLGWDAVRASGALPLSSEVEAERTGAQCAPGFFAYCVAVGARVRDQREAQHRATKGARQ